MDYFILLLLASNALCYELGGVLSGNSMGSVPLGISLGEGEVDVEGICTKPGVTCKNCTHAVTCIPLPVGWLRVPLQECSKDQSCNAREGGCSNIKVPECEKSTHLYEHHCEQVGIFPDAFDCRKFHLCSPPENIPSGRPADHRIATCPLHYGYDPHTAQCSIKLSHGQCDYTPVSKCHTIGQTEVLKDSPNHYYVCLTKNDELYPQVFVCPHGWHFIDRYCRPKPELIPNDKEIFNNRDVTKEKIEEKPTSVPVVEAKPVTELNNGKVYTEYPKDTFLADKFDLNNYEAVEDIPVVAPNSYEFSSSSFESF